MEEIKVQTGRPMTEVDFAPILHHLQPRSMGWRRLAALYFEKTGQLVSRETLKRRFEENYPLLNNLPPEKNEKGKEYKGIE